MPFITTPSGLDGMCAGHPNEQNQDNVTPCVPQQRPIAVTAAHMAALLP